MRWERRSAPGPDVIHLFREQLDATLEQSATAFFLGLDAGQPVFALDTSELHDDEVAHFLGIGEFIDLREVGWLLDAQQAALLAYARGLAFWNRHHRYCGKCGHPTLMENGGHMRRCSNSACGRMHFPRTDPAVIMLVEDLSDPDRPRCLLGRNARFPSRMMSTLAGFVDPLESLEETRCPRSLRGMWRRGDRYSLPGLATLAVSVFDHARFSRPHRARARARRARARRRCVRSSGEWRCRSRVRQEPKSPSQNEPAFGRRASPTAASVSIDGMESRLLRPPCRGRCSPPSVRRLILRGALHKSIAT